MRTNRKGISPVLATVILIAICLVVAIAITGFIFGLFGGFEHNPQVTASSELSSDNGLGPTGTVTLYNTGNANIGIDGMTLTYGGQTCNVQYTVQGGTLVANSQMDITVQASGYPSNNGCGTVGTFTVPESGESYSGQAILSNGSPIPFAGTFQ